MKKKLSLLLAVCFAAICVANAESPEITGTWRIIERNDKPLPATYKALKMITPTHFIWTMYDAQGNIINGAGGKYTLKENIYTESIDMVLPGMKTFYKTTWIYEVKVIGKKMVISGSVGDMANKETWEKVE